MDRMGELIITIVNFILGLIILLLGIRFVLRLLGASQTSGFVDWIYDNSQPFLNPIGELFPTPVIGDRFVLEINTLVSIFLYALIAFLIAVFIRAISNAAR